MTPQAGRPLRLFRIKLHLLADSGMAPSFASSIAASLLSLSLCLPRFGLSETCWNKSAQIFEAPPSPPACLGRGPCLGARLPTSLFVVSLTLLSLSVFYFLGQLSYQQMRTLSFLALPFPVRLHLSKTYTHTHTHVCLALSLSLSIYLSIYLSICLCIQLSTYLSTYLLAYLSLSLTPSLSLAPSFNLDSLHKFQVQALSPLHVPQADQGAFVLQRALRGNCWR